MHTNNGIRVLFLVCLLLSVLNLGCGGGGQFSPPVSQPVSEGRKSSQKMQSPVLGFALRGG